MYQFVCIYPILVIMQHSEYLNTLGELHGFIMSHHCDIVVILLVILIIVEVLLILSCSILCLGLIYMLVIYLSLASHMRDIILALGLIMFFALPLFVLDYLAFLP